MKLLDLRAFELKSAVHDVFDHVWNSLVRVDKENGKTAIFQSREGNAHFTAFVTSLIPYRRTDESSRRCSRPKSI